MGKMPMLLFVTSKAVHHALYWRGGGGRLVTWKQPEAAVVRWEGKRWEGAAAEPPNDESRGSARWPLRTPAPEPGDVVPYLAVPFHRPVPTAHTCRRAGSATMGCLPELSSSPIVCRQRPSAGIRTRADRLATLQSHIFAVMGGGKGGRPPADKASMEGGQLG
jgi:hypothetical protein